MYIVMAPLERRPEKKTDTGEAAGTQPPSGPSTQPPAGGETIGDRIAAKGPAPQATTEAPAQQG
jgi:hypothetical protein